MPRRIESIDVSVEELEQLVDIAGAGPLPAEGQRKLKAVVQTLGTMAEMLAEKDTTIQQLRELLLPARTCEKTRKVLDQAGRSPDPSAAPPTSRKKGHGRHSAGAYAGARKVKVPHPTLQTADRCPECQKKEAISF